MEVPEPRTVSRKAAIAGVYEHPARFVPDKTMFQIMAESARGALADAGLTIKDVDGVFCALGGMSIVTFCDYMNLTPNYVDSTAVGGASFVAQTTHAAAAINAMGNRGPTFMLFFREARWAARSGQEPVCQN